MDISPFSFAQKFPRLNEFLQVQTKCHPDGVRESWDTFGHHIHDCLYITSTSTNFEEESFRIDEETSIKAGGSKHSV